MVVVDVPLLIAGGENEPHKSKSDKGWHYYIYRSSYFQN
jgi:hypothetical protein